MVISAQIWLGIGNQRQLAEIEIEWLDFYGYDKIWSCYSARVAVDTGPDVRILQFTFLHKRETENVLGLLEAMLLELEDEKKKLSGPMQSEPKDFNEYPRELEG